MGSFGVFLDDVVGFFFSLWEDFFQGFSMVLSFFMVVLLICGMMSLSFSKLCCVFSRG